MAIEPDEEFPTPEWPPIQNLDSVDIVGRRRDGGVNLVIVVSQPLDASEETLESIRFKVGGYLEVIDIPEFQTEMNYPSRDQITISVHCDFPIHPRARAVLEECQQLAAQQGVELVIVTKSD